VVLHAGCARWRALECELKLCSKLLQADDRNFHCWVYRRYITGLAGRTPREEVDFMTEKINANFSNYSAWHHRSKLLHILPAGSVEQELPSELELVRQAFYTEPADQSAWMYHRWLLGKSTENQPLMVVAGCVASRQLLLAFSEPVRAVSAASISVHAVDGAAVEGLTWQPYSTAMTGAALIWSAELSPEQLTAAARWTVEAVDAHHKIVALADRSRVWEGGVSCGEIQESIVGATTSVMVGPPEPALVTEANQVAMCNGVEFVMGKSGGVLDLLCTFSGAIDSLGSSWVGGVGDGVICGDIQRFGFWEAVDDGCSWRLCCITPPLSVEDAASVMLDLATAEVQVEFCGAANVNPTVAAPALSQGEMESILIEEIHAIRELLSLEADSKWAQFTLARIYRQIGWPKRYFVSLLDKLMLGDPMRRRYYADLASQWAVEDACMHCLHSESCSLTSLDMTKSGLVSLPNPQRLAVPFLTLRSLNLSGNCISCTLPFAPPAFPLLEELNLDGNSIEVVAAGTLTKLPALKKLQLKSNGLLRWEGLKGCKAALDVRDNPMVEESDFQESIIALCPMLQATSQLGLFAS